MQFQERGFQYRDVFVCKWKNKVSERSKDVKICKHVCMHITFFYVSSLSGYNKL